MEQAPSPTSPKPARSGRITRAAAALLLLLAGVFIGRYLVPAGVLPNNSPLRFVTVEEGKRQLIFPTFWEAWDNLHEKFINPVDDEKLYYGAVAGMIQAAEDPYTTFANPLETKRFEETIEGSFSGVGIEIGLRSGLVTVIAPLEGSPAQQAGVQAGDVIVAVDHQPLTPDATLDEVVNQIRGERGSVVVLTVVHKDARETSDIEITRDRIEIESVKYEQDGPFAVITITNFNGDTSARFNTVARQALKANTQGIILDLRNNPGGFLQTAVEIASRFLATDQIVVSERGKTVNEYTAEGNALLQGVPTVVLVNGGSASASEILAGALHDQTQASIIGTKTFGKGSVQEFIKLKDGSSMRVTVAKWFTPNGRNINDEGIEPTVAVEQDQETDADEQMERAKEELGKLIDANGNQ